MPFTDMETGSTIDDAMGSVCPIVEFVGFINGEAKYRFSGTGFYVSNNGIALTALHCLILPNNGKWTQGPEPLSMFMIRTLPDNSGIINSVKIELVQIRQTFAIENLDLAILTAATPDGIRTRLQLSSKIPSVGDEVYCYSCPNTPGKIDNISGVLEINHTDFSGKVTAHLPEGRGKIFPGECFEVHMEAPGGTSGGPVFNANGAVVGVISTGMGGTPPIAYFAPVATILDVKFRWKFEDGMDVHSLRSLAKLGIVEIVE